MDFTTLATECANFVSPTTLEAIVKTESNFDPLKIGVNGGSKLQRQPFNIDEAVVTAQWLLENGYNIDLGLGQVNSSNMNRVGLSISDAFDPCKNLKASGTIFNTSFQAAMQQYPQEQALQLALSAYNTGNYVQGFKNGYVNKVLNNMQEPHLDQANQNSIGVKPIPLVNPSHKPTIAEVIRPKVALDQTASVTLVTVDKDKTTKKPKKPTSVFVYQSDVTENEAKPVDAANSTKKPEQQINVYNDKINTNIMVYSQ